ncbi:MAG: TetR/AcrR family transcriptional regulator [Clostridiales Family XIII bacterium]|jgi:AcrR family transcriptional regulator|nr:TetR/AcrR family transcriptional regulator [Clostridiales Family XIII bacterium]
MPTQTFRNLPRGKRDKVLAAAINEFSLRNVDEAKFSNIVKDAGIPRGSIYQYFDSKDDLYVYAFEALREQRGEFAKPAFEDYKTKPFLEFFERYYTLDSEFLLRHPQHIDMGKVLYSHARGVSLGLIQAIKARYNDIFIIGIDYDKDHGRMRPDVNGAVLADFCIHLMTDIFIFQNITERMSLSSVKKHLAGTMEIIRRGVE